MEKFAIFRIAEELFGISINTVVEIIRLQKVFTIPGLPDFLTGVINVRGSVIPLIDLRKRFGAEPSGRKERIIVVRFGGEKIGLLVDEIREIMALAPAEISLPPAVFKGFRTDYLNGLGKKGGVVIILLNAGNLLTSAERIRLEESMELIGEAKDAGIQQQEG